MELTDSLLRTLRTKQTGADYELYQYQMEEPVLQARRDKAKIIIGGDLNVQVGAQCYHVDERIVGKFGFGQ